MKKLFTILCAGMLFLSSAEAKIVMTESFDREIGTLNIGMNTSMGSNTSDWWSYSGSNNYIKVDGGSLSFAGYKSSGVGNKAHIWSSGADDFRKFEGVSSGKVHLAAIINVEELRQGTSGDYFLSLGNGGIGGTDIFARLSTKSVSDGSSYVGFRLGLNKCNESTTFMRFTDEVYSPKTNYLVVVEYEFVSGEKNDEVRLYVNPTKDTKKATLVCVQDTTNTAGTSSVGANTKADAAQLGAVYLRQGTNTPRQVFVDEIKVATSWNDLFEDGGDTPPEPTPAIYVESTVDFGSVTVDEPVEKTINVKGSDLKGDISILSNSALLVPAVHSISKAEAEAGFDLKLTLTATEAGAGLVSLFFTSEDAEVQTTSVFWNAASKPGEEGTNLILNHSFEEYSCNAMFGCSFDDWSGQGNGASASTDKLDGEVSLLCNPTLATTLDQGVHLTDADYAPGSRFQLTLNYKVISMPEGGKLSLDCFWEAAAGGDWEATEAHDSDILRVDLESGSSWMQKVVVTSKPAKSAYFRVRVKIPKSAKVLFDNFSLYLTPSTDPFIDVTPETLNSISAILGETADFQTIHIRQGNLEGPTSFELSYTDADQFLLSQTSLAADQSECDLVITYKPTKAGAHVAYLNIDNLNHTTLHRSIKLEGTCTDPGAQPEVTVTPSVVPAFEAVAGQEQKQTIRVKSVNCTDYLYLRVDHITGAAFTVGSSMLAKNSEQEVEISFKPVEAVSYQSTLTIYSGNGEFDNIVLTLNGTGKPATPETVDWQADFNWDISNPMTLMIEPFDNIEHNKTLLKDRWQNVADPATRPWWGFDEAKTTPARGTETYAKATAYQSGKDQTGIWDMWLVTPPLDYKNAASKLFTFKVMGEYLPKEGIEAALEVYYIDPSNPAQVLKQDLTAAFDIPTTSDENLVWRTFYMDLTPYAETMADVFCMAFRYVGPNGNSGAVTYYIDDVSWGRTDLPMISVDIASIAEEAELSKEKVLGTVNVTGKNLTQPINVSVKGANYNVFSISGETLPAEGGALTILFQSDQEGVHEAYIELSSSEAVPVYIPMSVLCKSKTEGIKNVQRDKVQGTKILRDGKLYLLYYGKMYDVQGRLVD